MSQPTSAVELGSPVIPPPSSHIDIPSSNRNSDATMTTSEHTTDVTGSLAGRKGVSSSTRSSDEAISKAGSSLNHPVKDTSRFSPSQDHRSMHQPHTQVTTSEQDVAPLDLPSEQAYQQDHEPFQVLAEHLTGQRHHSESSAQTTQQQSPYEHGDKLSKLYTPGGGFQPPPDGGSEAWLVIAGAWLILFVQFGFITSYGQFEQYYRANQLSNHSHSDIAWIGSLATFACFFGSILSGRYFDGHGARGLIWGGTSLSVIALFCLAFCKVYYQFLLTHLLVGIAAAVLYSPCTAVVSHWFLHRRSTAVGIILCGSGLGGVIFPIILTRLFPKIGFRNTVLVVAGMATVMFLPSWFTVKARLPPKERIPWRDAVEPWKEGRYTVFVLGVALIWMNYFTPFFFANDFAIAQGVSDNLATYSVAILNAGSFIGRGLSGPLAGKVGTIEAFITNGILSGIIVLALWTSPAVGTVGTIFGLFLYGLFSGVVISLIAACCAQLSPVREFGLRLGMMWTVASLPLLAGPQICGVLIQKHGNYTSTSIFTGVTLVAGSCLSFAPVMYRRIRNRIGRKEKDPELAAVVDEKTDTRR